MKYCEGRSLLLMHPRMPPPDMPQGERKVEPNPSKEQLALLPVVGWLANQYVPCITKSVWLYQPARKYMPPPHRRVCITTQHAHHSTACAWAFPGARLIQPSTVLWNVSET